MAAYLAFASPAWYAFKAQAFLSPELYDNVEEYYGLYEGDDEACLRDIITATLQGIQKSPSHNHYDRLQDLTVGRDVRQLSQGITLLKASPLSAYAMGCDEKLCIGIGKDIRREALPFILSHELHHVLNEDVANVPLMQAIVGLAMASIGIFALQMGALTLFPAMALAHLVTNYAYCYLCEGWADDFALEQSLSLEELAAAREFFTGKLDAPVTIQQMLTHPHPSLESRIAKINAQIEQMTLAQATSAPPVAVAA